MIGPAEVMAGVIQSLGDFIGDSAPMSRWDILRQSRDPQTPLANNGSVIGLKFPLDQAKQGALSLAVTPQQAEPFTWLDCQISLIEQPGTSEG
jgi:hypothetical protein